MIEMQKVKDSLEAAMCTDQLHEFVVEFVPDMINEIEQLRNEKNLLEIQLADAEKQIKELEDVDT